MKTKLDLVDALCTLALACWAEDESNSDYVGIDRAVIEYERRQQDEAAAQRQSEMQKALAREAAHARMPSKMYASTPSDPNTVPHALPAAATVRDSMVELVIPRYLESVADAEA